MMDGRSFHFPVASARRYSNLASPNGSRPSQIRNLLRVTAAAAVQIYRRFRND